MKKPIIIIGGPTACGKSNLAINLAKKIKGEIISADSMQVYKYMDIGTAKPSFEDLKEIKHYLIDEIDPREEFSVAIFKEKAKIYIEEIYYKKKIPIIVGGTGFYINSIIYDTNFYEEKEKNISYRKYLYEISENNKDNILHKMLEKIDPLSAKNIHKNNRKRIIRALEYFYNTGKEISKHNLEEKEKEKAYNVDFFILNMDRKKLYEKINFRVDEMIKNGLVEEVENLLEKGFLESLTTMKAIGYKEIIDYLKGKCSLECAIDTIKRNTRRFAKRQITWFKHQSNGVWLNVDEFCSEENLLNYIINLRKYKNT